MLLFRKTKTAGTPGGPRGAGSGGHVGQQLPLKVDALVKAKDRLRGAVLGMKAT